MQLEAFLNFHRYCGKGIRLLFVFLFLNSPCFASLGNLKLLYEKHRNIHGHDWVYRDDIEQHRQEFLKWAATYADADMYSRVILTVNCRDADDIPKCPNAGKVFYEDGNSYQLMHNGVKVLKDCYYGSWATDLIYGLKGHHEPQEEKVFYEVLKHIPAKAVMIELGSYWAYYSLWFSKAILGAINYLIEPDLECLNIGKKNFALNGAEGSFIHGYVGTYGGSQRTSQLGIDSFLETHQIEHVHILHSDIQGSEYQMLQSASRSIQSNKIDYFFISTHSEQLHTDCIDFLKSHNYVIIAEHSPSESYSADGLVVGKRAGLSSLDTVAISKHRS